MQEEIKTVILTLLLIVGASCCSNLDCGNGFGISTSSYESKQYGVFINYYHSEKKSIICPNDSSNLNIKEIYREYIFQVGKNNEIIPTENSRIIIRFDDTIPSNYSINWLIGSYDSIYFTSGKDFMSLNLKERGEINEIKLPIGFLDLTNKIKVVDELVLKKGRY